MDFDWDSLFGKFQSSQPFQPFVTKSKGQNNPDNKKSVSESKLTQPIDILRIENLGHMKQRVRHLAGISKQIFH